MSNPVLKENLVEDFSALENELESATVSGTIFKTFIMLGILSLCAYYPYVNAVASIKAVGTISDKIIAMAVFGAIGAFITALVIIFKRKSKTTAPLSLLYAGLEGLFVGTISALFAAQFGASTVTGAVFGTIASLFVMLFLYSVKIIKCTEKFMSTLLVAMLAVILTRFGIWIMHFFNPAAGSLLFGNSNIGIAASAVVCLIAAFNFIVDFDTIEQAQKQGLNKSFEWYGAFSLMITIIWLYMEMLRLLAKINSRR